MCCPSGNCLGSISTGITEALNSGTVEKITADGPLSNSEQSSIDISATLADMSNLLLVNLPPNASNRELHGWMESRGIDTNSIRMIPNILAGMSTAVAELKDGTDINEAIAILNGKKMRTQIVLVTNGRNP